MTIAKIVKRKTKHDLKDYCEMRGLSLHSLYNGYVSEKAKKAFEKDGIKIEKVAQYVGWNERGGGDAGSEF